MPAYFDEPEALTLDQLAAFPDAFQRFAGAADWLEQLVQLFRQAVPVEVRPSDRIATQAVPVAAAAAAVGPAAPVPGVAQLVKENPTRLRVNVTTQAPTTAGAYVLLCDSRERAEAGQGIPVPAVAAAAGTPLGLTIPTRAELWVSNPDSVAHTVFVLEEHTADAGA